MQCIIVIYICLFYCPLLYLSVLLSQPLLLSLLLLLLLLFIPLLTYVPHRLPLLVLDDTCKTLHGTKATLDVDRKFLDTAKQIHGSHAHFRAVPNAFIVKHYAGEVTVRTILMLQVCYALQCIHYILFYCFLFLFSFFFYNYKHTNHYYYQYDCGKLAESNKDALDNDLLGLIKSSEDKLLTHLFRNIQHTQPPTSGGSSSGGAAPVVPSAGTRIRQQCQLLVTALMECSPHYVRW